jgi:hypothetical protein
VTRAVRRVLAIVAVALAVAPRPARAQEQAPSDSSLHRFLDTLADSTDRYFGLIAAPLDTTGLDSALTAGLARPWRAPRTRVRPRFGPVYAFNRVDGTLWGGSVALRGRDARWRLGGDLGYAAGSDAWLGGGELALGARRRDTMWSLRVTGGRRTELMNRDHGERRLASVRALLTGSDRQNYLRRDGVTVTLGANAAGWRAAVEYRDRLESPLAVTTRWNLAHSDLAAGDNLAALPGRAREVAFDGDLRLGGSPFHAQLTHQTSDQAIGSDFDYRRARLAVGGEIVAGGRVSLVPQLVYGRLVGDPVPQAAFFLGGSRTLKSLRADSLGGTAVAIARLEMIGVDDLLALAHIPHPAMVPVQGGLFAATGAVWGVDPFGGPGTAEGGWPDRSAWRSEVGVSLLYRPGLPDENAYLRMNLAWPVGPHGNRARWSVSYSRALDMLRAF